MFHVDTELHLKLTRDGAFEQRFLSVTEHHQNPLWRATDTCPEYIRTRSGKDLKRYGLDPSYTRQSSAAEICEHFDGVDRDFMVLRLSDGRPAGDGVWGQVQGQGNGAEVGGQGRDGAQEEEVEVEGEVVVEVEAEVGRRCRGRPRGSRVQQSQGRGGRARAGQRRAGKRSREADHMTPRPVTRSMTAKGCARLHPSV